jgi:hypothetical protein
MRYGCVKITRCRQYQDREEGNTCDNGDIGNNGDTWDGASFFCSV